MRAANERRPRVVSFPPMQLHPNPPRMITVVIAVALAVIGVVPNVVASSRSSSRSDCS